MKKVRISLMFLIVVSSCNLFAMRGDRIESPLRNEPEINAGCRNGETDQQRVERLRLERQKALEANPETDFYNEEQIKARVENHIQAQYPVDADNPDAKSLDQDGDPFNLQDARNSELDKAQLAALDKIGEEMNFAAKSRLESIPSYKSENDFSVRIKTDLSMLEDSIARVLRNSDDSSDNRLLNKNPRERVQAKVLDDQAKALSKAIDADLLKGKGRFGRRSEKNKNDIREKLKDLKMVKNELDMIMNILRKKELRLQKIPGEINSLRNRNGGRPGEIKTFIEANKDLLTPKQVLELEKLLPFHDQSFSVQQQVGAQEKENAQQVLGG